MAIKPGVNWQGPVPNKTPSGMHLPILGLVLHIEQGSEAGSGSWFHNPRAQASAHFGNPKAGRLDQWVDTSDKAWAEMAGNSRWISVEHEGFAGQSLTAGQLENDADLYAWLHHLYAVPLQTTNDINMGGLGWHGMGGQLWGGHLSCPSNPIKAARPAILKAALTILHQAPPGSHPAAPATPSTAHPAVRPAGSVPKMMHTELSFGSEGADVRALQAQLRARGWRVSLNGVFNANTRAAVASFQAEKHLKVDGIVGAVAWHALFVATVTK